MGSPVVLECRQVRSNDLRPLARIPQPGGLLPEATYWGPPSSRQPPLWLEPNSGRLDQWAVWHAPISRHMLGQNRRDTANRGRGAVWPHQTVRAGRTKHGRARANCYFGHLVDRADPSASRQLNYQRRGNGIDVLPRTLSGIASAGFLMHALDRRLLY